jgi:hypothetical protein
MPASRLSSDQVRIMLFQFYDDQVVRPGSDVTLSARLLRVIDGIAEDGVLSAVLKEGRENGRLVVLADHREAQADTPCVRLLDYLELSKA